MMIHEFRTRKLEGILETYNLCQPFHFTDEQTEEKEIAQGPIGSS